MKNISFRYEKKSPDVLKETKGRFAANTISCLVGWQRKWKDDFTAADGKAVSTVSWEMSSVNFSYLPQNPMYLLLEETVQKEWDKMSQCSKELFLRFGLDELKKKKSAGFVRWRKTAACALCCTRKRGRLLFFG